MPVVGLKTLADVVGVRQFGRALDADVVVIVETNELGEAQMSGQGSGLVRCAFHQIAVATENVGEMVDDLVAWAIVNGRQMRLGGGHAHGIHHALTERTGGGFHAGCVPIFRVSGRAASPLPKVFDIVECQIEAGQMQHRIEQHGGVTVREHKAVTVKPVRILRVEIHHAGPQRVGSGRQRHRRARVT